MDTPLRILYLEDDATDAALVQATLEEGGVASKITRVETQAAFCAALEQDGFDLVLADYTLPSFDGLSALKMAVERRPEVPFIFLSGTLSEDVAIEALKIGASDYVFKTRLSRIVPSVRRALREGRERAERMCAREALRRSEAYLAEAQRLSHTGSFGWDVVSGDIYWSQETFRIFEFEPASNVTLERILERTHPDDRTAVQQLIERVSQERTDFDFQHRLLMPDGSTKHIRVVGRPATSESGSFEFVGAVTDISDRKLADALLTGERGLLEMIATGVPLKEILNALCLVIEEQRSGTLASVLLLNPDGIHLDSAAGPHLPEEWKRQMASLAIGPCAGSCGTAAFRKSPVIVSDIATDPLWDVPEHRAAALRHGLRASWSNPILSPDGKVLGTFCMYYRETRSPTAEDLERIELAVHLTRVAIERDRGEAALRASEQLARGQVEALVQSLDVLATAPAPDQFILRMLSTMGRLLGGQWVALWLLDEATDALVLRAAVKGENSDSDDSAHPFVKDPFAWKEDVGLQELFFTGVPVAYEDVDTDPRIPSELRAYFQSQGTRKFLRLPTLVGGKVKGFITIRHAERAPYQSTEIELAQALAHQAMLAIQSRQAATLEERNRMARDIHDTLAQGFTAIVVQLQAAQDANAKGFKKEAEKHLQTARDLARQSLTEARRSVQALRPQALEDRTFWDALKGMIKQSTAGTALQTRFQVRGQPRGLPPHWQENLLHIGQEALTNTLKYARAARFEARLSFNKTEVRVEFEDDGEGFTTTDRHDGFGLIGMRERVKQMGGALSVTSARGKGTKIVVVSPYAPGSPA